MADQKRILIVDDEKDLRAILKRAVDTFDFLDEPPQVDEAPDGLEALKQLQNHNYDLIVTDFIMPSCSGLQLVQKIREEGKANKNVPIIFISAFLPKIDANLPSHILDEVVFLEKPLRLKQISRFVRLALKLPSKAA